MKYTDIPVGERRAFELVCVRRGFPPTHFDVSQTDHAVEDEAARLITVRRGGWSRSYQQKQPGDWARQFELDLLRSFLVSNGHARVV